MGFIWRCTGLFRVYHNYKRPVYIHPIVPIKPIIVVSIFFAIIPE